MPATAHRLLDLPARPAPARQHRMTFRLPADRWEALSRAASARNATPSDLVRHLVALAMEEADAGDL
jgi:uncharacterized protein (DUF1778 family)